MRTKETEDTGGSTEKRETPGGARGTGEDTKGRGAGGNTAGENGHGAWGQRGIPRGSSGTGHRDRGNAAGEHGARGEATQTIKTPGSGHLLFRDGSKVPLVRSNGLFYCDVMFRRSAPMAAQARLRADDLALLWAARLNLSADNLVLTSKAVLGVNVDKVTPTQREMLARSRWPGT